jgi:hypothetical protein
LAQSKETIIIINNGGSAIASKKVGHVSRWRMHLSFVGLGSFQKYWACMGERYLSLLSFGRHAMTIRRESEPPS